MMKNVVPNENCLTEAQLLHYLHDECSTAEEKAIDRHLTICPMCSDALEGAMLLNSARLERSLGRLDVKIETRFLDKKQVEEKAAFIAEEPIMTVVKSPRKLGWLWAAASVTVLAVASLWFFTKPLEYQNAASVASNTQNPTVLDTLGVQPSAVGTTEVSPNTAKTSAETGNADPKQPVSTEKEVAIATEKPNNTEGTPAAAKVEDTKSNNGAVAGNDKAKELSETNTSDNANVTAQNNDRPTSPSRSVKVKPSTVDGLADYQIGMRFYQKGAFNEAVVSLNNVLAKQKSGDLYQNALWSLANSYLKLGRKQDAQILLKRIVAEKGKYTQQAADLLK